MSTTVSYKGQTLATVSNQTKTLLTEGKYLEDDLTLVDVSGGGATLITKNISANGTYNASSDSADGYSQVNVSVPNTYAAGDEGKVVSNGALVAQTAHADVTPTTSDQTIDTTTNNSIKVKGDADLVASNIKKDVEIFGVTGNYEGGGGGSGAIETVVIENSTGDVTFDAILQALEDMDYTLSNKDCVLYFRANGQNAAASPPTNYSYNCWTVIVKDWAVWMNGNTNYSRCGYGGATQKPDTFRPFATNNEIQNSQGIIDSNHKIVNTYASAFQAGGGQGTTVVMVEAPADWTNFLST